MDAREFGFGPPNRKKGFIKVEVSNGSRQTTNVWRPNFRLTLFLLGYKRVEKGRKNHPTHTYDTCVTINMWFSTSAFLALISTAAVVNGFAPIRPAALTRGGRYVKIFVDSTSIILSSHWEIEREKEVRSSWSFDDDIWPNHNSSKSRRIPSLFVSFSFFGFPFLTYIAFPCQRRR